MKAEHVFVLGIDSPGCATEYVGNVIGLQRRYGAHVIYVEPIASPSASNWADYIRMNGKLANDAHYADMVTRESDDVGIYIVSHGVSGTTGGLTGAQLADLIRALSFNSIRKICVVACHSGSVRPGIVDTSVIKDLCIALNPLKPMIAGYTSWVSALYDESNLKSVAVDKDDARAKQNGAVKGDALLEAKSHAQKMVQINNSKDKMGAKILMKPQAQNVKDQVKIVYKYIDGAATVIPCRTGRTRTNRTTCS